MPGAGLAPCLEALAARLIHTSNEGGTTSSYKLEFSHHWGVHREAIIEGGTGLLDDELKRKIIERVSALPQVPLKYIWVNSNLDNLSPGDPVAEAPTRANLHIAPPDGSRKRGEAKLRIVQSDGWWVEFMAGDPDEGPNVKARRRH